MSTAENLDNKIKDFGQKAGLQLKK